MHKNQESLPTHPISDFGVASLRYRKRDMRGRGRALSLTGYGLVLASAYLGGYLVFRDRVGTDRANRSLGPSKFVPVLPWADLNEEH